MARKFTVIYSGTLAPGITTMTARVGLAKALGITESQAHGLLDGGSGVVFETEDRAGAEKMLDRLKKAGLEVSLKTGEEPPAQPGPEPGWEQAGESGRKPSSGAPEPEPEQPARHCVFFTGALSAGITTMTARDALAEALGLSKGQAHNILDGGPGVIFETTDRAEAEKMLDRLAAAGLEVRLEGSPGHASDGAGPDQTAAGSSGQGSRILNFEFNGKGGEYFRIWLVNSILSLITLGIYSAWAKVRRRQYLYSNTRLDGSVFEYLANPVKILKGRILVAIILAIMWAFQTFLPLIGMVLSLGFWLLLPWLVIRSMKFNYYNTSYRNIRFGFEAAYGKSFEVFVLWPVLGILTLGIIWPLVYRKQQEFLVNHSRYGQTYFEFRATTGQYYKIALGTFLFMLLGALIGLGIGYVFEAAGLQYGRLFSLLVVYLFSFAYFSVKRTNLLYNSTFLGRQGFECDQKTGSFLWLVLSNTFMTAITLGLFHAWAKVRTARYKAVHLRLAARGDLNAFIAAEEKSQAAFGEELADMLDLDLGL